MMQYEDRSNIADRVVGDSSSAETLKWDDVVRLARHGDERSNAHPWQERESRFDRFRGLAQLHASEVSQPGRVDAKIKQSARSAMSCPSPCLRFTESTPSYPRRGALCS